MQEMSVTYSQLDREARKAAKLAQCAAERAAFLAALTEKETGRFFHSIGPLVPFSHSSINTL